MTIHNGFNGSGGFTGYQRTMTKRLAGTPASFRMPLTRPILNPLRQAVWRVAVGTFADDDDTFTIRITEPDGTRHSVTITRAGGSPADAAAAATAAAAALNALASLIGVATALASTTNVDITFLHAGIDYLVEIVDASGVTVTATETTDPAGSALPIARFVALASDAQVDGNKAVQLPSGATSAQIRGFVMRALGQHVNAESPLASAVDSIPAGQMGDMAFEGEVNAKNAGTVAASMGDPVYAVTDASGGLALGEAIVEGSIDEVGAAQVSTIVPVVDRVEYGFILVLDGVTYPAHYTPTDGTTAVADAIDGLYDSLVGLLGGATSAANGKGVTITESDTELTITTDAGVAIDDLKNSVWTADTEAASTVATIGTSGVRAVQVPGAYWAEDVPAGEVGPIMLRM